MTYALIGTGWFVCFLLVMAFDGWLSDELMDIDVVIASLLFAPLFFLFALAATARELGIQIRNRRRP